METHEYMLSDENKLRIQDGESPIVDDQWLEHNRSHRNWKGQTLEHHHLDHGSMAIALPEKLHRGRGWMRIWHNLSRASKGLTAAMNIYSIKMDFFSDDPHSTRMLFENGMYMDKLYFDSQSNQYYEWTGREQMLDERGNVMSTTDTYNVYSDYTYDKKSKKYVGTGLIEKRFKVTDQNDKVVSDVPEG
ncbi:hypothetical protein [Sporocytophaga myxococcoides]|uniref:hypothetical protein n=1 Tax=Sporocytophaga myxococcoides TaxID=153721 RepID=UPI0003FB53E8|nr:hypothetical protein [Sporocytophaga myxococcoides]